MPVPLEMPAGTYPLSAAVVNHRGETAAFEISLHVEQKKRPLSRLTLPEQMVTPKAAETLTRIAAERQRLKKLFNLRSTRLWTVMRPPVDDPVNSIFGKRRVLNDIPKDPHSGTDFRSSAGTEVSGQ